MGVAIGIIVIEVDGNVFDDVITSTQETWIISPTKSGSETTKSSTSLEPTATESPAIPSYNVYKKISHNKIVNSNVNE